MVEPQPVPATHEVLGKVLDSRPVLWVGAGTSMAAGHPGTGRLVEAMAERCLTPIDTGQPFEQVADAFVSAMGGSALADLLQQELGGSPPLTSLHRALARAAGDGKLAALVTTNYDDLLERALGEAEVRYLPQGLEDNAVVVDPEAPVRLLKLHGSRTDWERAVLSGEAYERFGVRYPFLEQQLSVLLRQHPVLFVGCSLQDRRILEWLEALDDGAAGRLKPWPALLTRSEWETAWAGGREALARARLLPLILDDHDHLPRLWVQVVPERPAAGEVEIAFEVGADGWVGRLDRGEEWAVEDPWEDEGFLEGLKVLRAWGVRALPADDHGGLAAEAAHLSAALRQQAVAVGERLAGMLSPAAQERLAELEAAGRPELPGLLRLQVAVGPGGDAQRADRLLALPWELLRVGDRFPVEENTFDLVREAVVPGEPGLGEPRDEMSVVATVAAPVDQKAVDHEQEMYRLWQALGAEDEGRLRVTDLGTLDDLAATVEEVQPPVIHFTGHGVPGALLFEDPAAGSHKVDVRELIQRLKSKDTPLPRLIYLSSCHGTTAVEAPVEAAAGGLVGAGAREASSEAAREAGEREGGRLVDAGVVELQPATAAALHRGGFAQVVGYLGPVGDDQATRLAASFYAGLARGQKARVALREARELAKRPLRSGDGWALYPLGWAQVALYHRGGDHPTALPATAVEARLEAPPKRAFVRLDNEGGWVRVERRHDGPVVGVQQLRHGFIGRRGPRAEALRRWREGERLLVVQGLGGLGKTALCAELLRMLPAAKVVALDGRHAGSQRDPLVALWQEVAAARPDPEWAGAVGALQREGLSGERLVQAFGLLAQAEGSLVVYLDDAESLQEPVGEGSEIGRWRDEELADWWQGMVGLAAPGGAVGVLASSRYRPEGTPGGAVLNLRPMSDWEMVRLMSWMRTLRRVPHGDREWLVGRLSGHPRTVEWLEVLAAQAEERLAPHGERFAGDWRGAILEPILEDAGERIEGDLLLEKVWQALDEGTREHLGRCTVIQAPAPWEAVLDLAPEGVEGSGGRLVDAGLLSPFQGEGAGAWWAPHRLVSETVGRLWEGDAGAAHRRLGGWYRERSERGATPLWDQRAVEHLCAGGDGDGAFPAAQRLALQLRDAGRYREALGWVERVLEAGVSGAERGLCILYESRMLRGAGAFPSDVEPRLLEALDLVQSEHRGHILHELGAYCHEVGRLQDAARYLQESVEVLKQHQGEDSTDLGASLHALAGVLAALGDLAGAQVRLERSLDIDKTVYGTEEHPSVAESLHALAGVLEAQGDLSGAGSRLERSLEIKAAVYGTEEHPAVAASLHNLALVLAQQGNLAGARALLERSLKIQAAVYGTEEHPAVAMALGNLAWVLHGEGNTAAAIETLRKVLTIHAAVFAEPDHPDTARFESDLGVLLLQTGQPAEALPLLRHALDVFKRKLGPDHPYTRSLLGFLDDL